MNTLHTLLIPYIRLFSYGENFVCRASFEKKLFYRNTFNATILSCCTNFSDWAVYTKFSIRTVPDFCDVIHCMCPLFICRTPLN